MNHSISTAVLDAGSLAHTLWNLEEMRIRGGTVGDTGVRDALNWVASRHGVEGSYRGVLFAPGPQDWTERLLTPTGENNSPSRAAVSHVLGEEAARALAVWKFQGQIGLAETSNAIGTRFGSLQEGIDQTPGRFCCYRCSVAWWRSLSSVQPEGWEQNVSSGMKLLGVDRVSGGRWHGFPFYYTLLTLGEIDMPEAREALQASRTAAERCRSKLTGEDQHTIFRRLAVDRCLAS